jgi:hypothetical protein
MVVLHEKHVVEAHAVVAGAASRGGLFFEAAKTGCGFSRIENTGAGSLNLISEAASERGHAGEVLEKIQSRALGGEDRGGISRDFENAVVGIE